MKKIISIFLTAVMLVGAFAVTAAADGTMYAQADFTDMETFTQHFAAGAFFTEGDGILYGYNEAKALQSVDEWFAADVRCEVALGEDDMATGDRAFSVVYPNTNLYNYGRMDGAYYMSFSYDVEASELWLTGGGISLDRENVLVGPIPFEGIDHEGEEFVSFGMSVERQRIRCFVNDELVIDYFDSADDYLIGLEDENTLPTCVLFWNDNNFLKVRDVKIASPGYLFPYAVADEGTSAPADTDAPAGGNDTPANTDAPADTPADPDKDAPADNDTPAGGNDAPAGDNGNADNNAPAGNAGNSGNSGNSGNAGNTPAQPAQTNTNKPAGGNATATGDATFAVACAMVITLGCALIVRKASVR